MQKEELYFPSAEDMEDIDLFGARFPLATPSLAQGQWELEKAPVPKGKDPKMAALRLSDDNKSVFNGAPQSNSNAAEQPTQHFALITRGNKTYAVPVDWFYVFKPARKVHVSAEEAAAMQTAKQEREAKLTKTFNKRFNIKDEEGEENKRVQAVSQLDALRKTTKQSKSSAQEDDAFKAIEPEIDELFAIDEQLAEGWDFEDDIANDDMETNVNREEAQDAEEEENAELEREHEELEKVLKKEGRVDKEENDGDEAYKIDLDEDEEDEAMPTVAASRRMEQEREKEGRKHMDKLRKKVKQNRTLLMSGLVGADDSDDSMDSEDDDSDDPASTQQLSPSDSQAGPSSGGRTAGENKRERPDDMVDAFVAVKRANVPLTSLLTRNERSNPPSGRATPSAPDGPGNGAVEDIDFQKITPEKYLELVRAVQTRWPTDPLGHPLTQRKLKDIIEVVKQAFQDVYRSRLSKQLIKPLLQLATKGGPGKDAMFKSAGKGADGKSTFNLA